jgi:hypothetical protein
MREEKYSGLRKHPLNNKKAANAVFVAWEISPSGPTN